MALGEHLQPWQAPQYYISPKDRDAGEASKPSTEGETVAGGGHDRTSRLAGLRGAANTVASPFSWHSPACQVGFLPCCCKQGRWEKRGLVPSFPPELSVQQRAGSGPVPCEPCLLCRHASKVCAMCSELAACKPQETSSGKIMIPVQ